MRVAVLRVDTGAPFIADATLVTQQLNDAHKKIKAAWERYQR